MNCKDMKPLLGLYLAKEMDLETFAKVESHLSSCAECGKDLALMRQVVEHLPKTPELSQDYWENFTRSVMGRIQTRPAPRFFVGRIWAPATAILLTFIVGSVVFYQRQQREKMKVEEIVSHLHVIENIELLERDDFDELIRNENKA